MRRVLAPAPDARSLAGIPLFGVRNPGLDAERHAGERITSISARHSARYQFTNRNVTWVDNSKAGDGSSGENCGYR